MTSIHHVGLIPDGNRRWADKNGLCYFDAYTRSMSHLSTFICHTFDMGINSMSVYLLSKENLSRHRDDLDAVLKVETNFILQDLPKLAQAYQCKIMHAGDTSLLPNFLSIALENIEANTHSFLMHRLYLLVGYNPMDEVNAALRGNPNRRLEITDLWVPETLDIVIRTAGGPVMLSNFLPLQSGYAQQVIVEAYFNDFGLDNFDDIVNKALQVIPLRGK